MTTDEVRQDAAFHRESAERRFLISANLYFEGELDLDGVIYLGKFTGVTGGGWGGPRAMANTRLGKVQFRIMQVLWERGKASARHITDALNRDGAIAHSTVQTLLRKMEQKGVVAHHAEDRTFIYEPLVDEPSVTRGATRDLIERVFGGSAAGLVAYLLREERIPPKELQRIRDLIDDRASGDKPDRRESTSNKGRGHDAP
jgi:BlaI family transcriptional regulator, penicillinase repressor